MVNHEVLSIVGSGTDNEVKFSSMLHMRFFNIILVDFLSKSDKKVMGEETSYLRALENICESPSFDVGCSITSLKEETKDFITWLNREIEIEVWLPTAEIEAMLKIKRIELIKICGNISKHSFSRLSGVANNLIKISERNSHTISKEDALIMLDEIYENCHMNILNYHSSTIAEFLNNLRWGVHEYLLPEFKSSKVILGGSPEKYCYTYPSDIKSNFCRILYWNMMNVIRAKPLLKKFKISRFLKLRY